MIEGLILAVLIAKIKRYKLSPIFKEWPVYLVFAGILAYLVMNFSISSGNTELLKYTMLFKFLFVSIFGIMVIKYGLYKTGFLSAALVATGGILNNIVIKANGGKMPVFPSLSYYTGYMTHETFANLDKLDDVHIQGGPGTKLSFLADWIDLGYIIMSIGDVLYISFVFLVFYSSIKYLNEKKSVKI